MSSAWLYDPSPLLSSVKPQTFQHASTSTTVAASVKSMATMLSVRFPPTTTSSTKASSSMLTYSGHRKIDAKRELLQHLTLSSAGIEAACFWSIQYMATYTYADSIQQARGYEELWTMLIYVYFMKYIHVANPKIASYLHHSYMKYKSLVSEWENSTWTARTIQMTGVKLQSTCNELLINYVPLRELMAEVIGVLCLSPKAVYLAAPIKITKRDYTDDTFSNKLQADNGEYIRELQVFDEQEDPGCLYIPLNELVYHIVVSQNAMEACYWIEWMLQFSSMTSSTTTNGEIKDRKKRKPKMLEEGADNEEDEEYEEEEKEKEKEEKEKEEDALANILEQTNMALFNRRSLSSESTDKKIQCARRVHYADVADKNQRDIAWLLWDVLSACVPYVVTNALPQQQQGKANNYIKFFTKIITDTQKLFALNYKLAKIKTRSCLLYFIVHMLTERVTTWDGYLSTPIVKEQFNLDYVVARIDAVYSRLASAATAAAAPV